MGFTKITAEDTANKGVVGLPDTPNLSTQEMQEKFDELATDVIIPKFNELSNELDEMDIEGTLESKISSDDITNIKVNRFKQIEVSRDGGITFETTASSGHNIQDGSGTTYPSRARLQFSDNVTVIDKEDTNATLISIPSGEKGERGAGATIRVGDVESGDTPEIVNVGSDTDAIFNFTLPKGDSGNAATVRVGTVQSGQNASVYNTGTTSDAILNFVLPKGEKGDAGTSFQIRGMYPTYEALIEAHPTGQRGDAYAVGTAEENTIYNWNNDTRVWDNLGGLKGAKGEDGNAATITVGSVTQGDHTFVENVGTSENAILNFTLEKGDKGDDGRSATVAVGNVSKGDTASVTNVGTTSNAVLDFVLPKGDKGEQGNPTTVNGKQGQSITLYGTDIVVSADDDTKLSEFSASKAFTKAELPTELEKMKNGQFFDITDDYNATVCPTLADCIESESIDDVAGASALVEVHDEVNELNNKLTEWEDITDKVSITSVISNKSALSVQINKTTKMARINAINKINALPIGSSSGIVISGLPKPIANKSENITSMYGGKASYYVINMDGDMCSYLNTDNNANNYLFISHTYPYSEL